MRDETGELLAGLTVSGPAKRLAERQGDLVTMLSEHAQQLRPLLA